jgi:sugar phosphate isomerase/epimerase
MEREYSVAHLTALICPPPELIYNAAMAGYDYVSLRPIYMGLPNEPNYDLAAQPELLSLTRRAMKDTGIRLHDIELARVFDEMDMEKYKRAMSVSAELGAKSVLSSIWTDNKQFYTEKFGELCDMAAGFGLNVDLEFVTWASVKNLKEAREVLEAVNRPNMGLMIDTLHFNRSRVSLEELDSVPREWFHFAHICDGPKEIPDTKEGLIHTGRDARLYVGEGGINIAEILRRVPTGTYSIELPNLERLKSLGAAEHMRRCLETAKRYIDEHLPSEE